MPAPRGAPGARRRPTPPFAASRRLARDLLPLKQLARPRGETEGYIFGDDKVTAQNQVCSIVIGATSGSGRHLAECLARRGDRVVISGRDLKRSEGVANEIGGGVEAIALDLNRPDEIKKRLAGVGSVRNLVLAAVERDANTVRNFDAARATDLVTMKLVGYVEAVHALADRFAPDASILLFGGVSRDRPYPGSTSITMANGGVTSMVRTLAIELAPVRVNAIHPGVIGDSPAWAGNAKMLEPTIARTPTRRLATMADISHACLFLLDNPAANGVNLTVDGGWLLA